jgi:hypothetical protein
MFVNSDTGRVFCKVLRKSHYHFKAGALQLKLNLKRHLYFSSKAPYTNIYSKSFLRHLMNADLSSVFYKVLRKSYDHF